MYSENEGQIPGSIDYSARKKYFGRLSIFVLSLFVIASLLMFLPLGHLAIAVAGVSAPFLNASVGIFDTVFYYLKLGKKHLKQNKSPIEQHKQRQRWIGVFSAIAWSLAALASVFVPGGMIFLGIALAPFCHTALALISSGLLYSYYRRYYSKHGEKLELEQQNLSLENKENYYFEELKTNVSLQIIRILDKNNQPGQTSREDINKLSEQIMENLENNFTKAKEEIKEEIKKLYPNIGKLLQEKNKYRMGQIVARRFGGMMSIVSATILLAGVVFPPLFGVAILVKAAAVACSLISGISLLRAEVWYAKKKQDVVEQLNNQSASNAIVKKLQELQQVCR